MLVTDLGTMSYRDAWAEQERAHEAVLAGGEERLFLVEHRPVITLGRRPGVARNLLASDEQLAKFGVEVVQSDRGGDITFHGPGQIVAYPIIRLIDHKLSVGGYVHGLENVAIQTLAEFGIPGSTDPAAVGVWVDSAGKAKKVCAIGVRIRRGVSIHGIALNVTTDLRFFNLIVPCGITDRGVTSMKEFMGEKCPPIETVKRALVERMMAAFS